MPTISFREDHISQIPALQLLQKLGYTYLTPEEALSLRGGKTSNVLLEPILRKQLEEINSIRVSDTKTTWFTPQNIENGIVALRNIPLEEGYISGSEYVYNLLTYGKSLEQSIDGDKKSFTLRYIDWETPGNNVFHVTEEYPVSRTGMSETYRPDIVLFINGIPLGIIECKRPDIKDSLKQAISQHLRNQKPEDGIRALYLYSALLLGIATSSCAYATTGTPEKFWCKWREQFADANEEATYKAQLRHLVNTPLSEQCKQKLFENRFRYVRQHFEEIASQPVEPTEQDAYLYGLCRPDRLMDFIFNFTLYDNGVKKIARYQQYFAVKKTIQRIRPIEAGRRKGGVIWHTQGSGKSLTMVMLAQAIVLEKSIRNPRIILVTDRTDLDRQITTTFKKCGVQVENPRTGRKLVELLEGNSDAVITTIINKFETAVRTISQPLTDPNIFVLIDEAHRSQYKERNIKMQKTLPNACFIAMTGTPLMKKEKNTAGKFGGIIRPVYTVDQAVKDGAVVPLLYEGRIVPQTVHENAIDNYFNMVCEPLTEYQRADMKKKFSRADQLSQSEQRITAIAWNISHHFRDNWKGTTPFKGQLVCPRKHIAIKYKKIFDEIGILSTEVLITAPDDREGEETAYGGTDDSVKAFWKKMMDEHGTPARYEANLISRFKNNDRPEIIIVVDKLLTGFDEPRNTVLYLDRHLSEHTLLQAVARVNRVHEDKEFGFVIDYYGVLGELNTALNLYSDYDPEEAEEINSTLTNINEEVGKLPQRYSELWDIFKSITNQKDLEAYSLLLRPEDIRQQFYDKLTAYARCLKIALSSLDFHNNTPEAEINRYKEDLAMFINLRSAVQQRYSDKIDYKQYEGQIQKLIDTHIESGQVQILTELTNIFDKEKFAEEVEKIEGKAAQADTIASRTARHITENMDMDPAFYKKFSEMLKETISAYEQGRIDQAEYLRQAREHMNNVLSRTDKDIPDTLVGNDTARSYYGISLEMFGQTATGTSPALLKELSTETALTFDHIIKNFVFEEGRLIVDWHLKDLAGRMKIEMGDYLIDNIRRKHGIAITFDDIDVIVDNCVEVAKKWLK